MAALTDADRQFLIRNWRWLEINDAVLHGRFPNARDSEFQSPFVTVDGATLALNIIFSMIGKDKRFLICTVDQLVDLSFRVRPPTVAVRLNRFSMSDLVPRKMVCVRATVDHQARETKLYLTG